MTDGARTRALAARAVSAVIDASRSLDMALAELSDDRSPADRGLIRMLAYGTLRDYRRLDALLALRVKRAPQPLLKSLLLVGLFQLEATRVPPHAAVHATVAAARILRFNHARGMVNAILRRHQREAAPNLDNDPGLGYSYPDWLVEAIAADWGEAALEVLAAGNRQAPMHLRVNTRRASRAAIINRLAKTDMPAEAVKFASEGITLSEPVATDHLLGFAEGELSVQDGAAQLAADLADLADGQRVLDACAAPGNKSAHLLERADMDLLALDIDGVRLATLETNLARLGLVARARVADAAMPDDWWDGNAFDRILLDAPCSGTGVIRRHPDIKWLRRQSDIAVAAARQRALLDALWPMLAPGGRLVYATCSILRAEGVDVVTGFMADRADARAVAMEAEWGEAEAVGRRIAPGQHGFDGFYYAVLQRSPVLSA